VLVDAGGLALSGIGPLSAVTFAMISYTASLTYRTNTVMEPIEEQIAKESRNGFHPSHFKSSDSLIARINLLRTIAEIGRTTE
jgi:hypothetical protein